MAFRVLSEKELSMMSDDARHAYELEYNEYRERQEFVDRLQKLDNVRMPHPKPKKVYIKSIKHSDVRFPKVEQYRLKKPKNEELSKSLLRITKSMEFLPSVAQTKMIQLTAVIEPQLPQIGSVTSAAIIDISGISSCFASNIIKYLSDAINNIYDDFFTQSEATKKFKPKLPEAFIAIPKDNQVTINNSVMSMKSIDVFNIDVFNQVNIPVYNIEEEQKYIPQIYSSFIAFPTNVYADINPVKFNPLQLINVRDTADFVPVEISNYQPFITSAFVIEPDNTDSKNYCMMPYSIVDLPEVIMSMPQLQVFDINANNSKNETIFTSVPTIPLNVSDVKDLRITNLNSSALPTFNIIYPSEVNFEETDIKIKFSEFANQVISVPEEINIPISSNKVKLSECFIANPQNINFNSKSKFSIPTVSAVIDAPTVDYNFTEKDFMIKYPAIKIANAQTEFEVNIGSYPVTQTNRITINEFTDVNYTAPSVRISKIDSPFFTEVVVPDVSEIINNLKL